jgi:signal transduction histidine kinase
MDALQLPSYADALTDGIGILDADGRVHAANDALARMLDYSSKEQLITGAGDESLFLSPDDRQACGGLLHGDGSIIDRQCTLQTRGGGELTVTVTALRRQDGLVDAVFVPLRGNVEEEAARLAELLRKTQTHMVQTDRIKAAGLLSGYFAHELNNVFGSVIGRAQLMQMKTTDERLLRESAYIVQAAEQGVGEVKRLLQFIHKSRQQFFGPMAAEEVFAEACAVIDPVAEKCRRQGIAITIETRFEEHSKIFGYVAEVREIMVHLLENAYDAMPYGGVITATCTYGNDELSLCIADTGTGISGDVQSKMFEPGFTTRDDQHAGMGLTVIKELLRKMKGNIGCSTEQGKGSTFVVTIPKNDVVPADAGRAGHARQMEMDARFVSKILIVDDDEGVLISLDKLLSSKGFMTKAILDGRDAVRVAHTFQPDILITDLAMPEINGWELAKQIRAICPSTKIILTTAFTEMLTDVQMKQTAVDVVMQKPINIPELLTAIMSE